VRALGSPRRGGETSPETWGSGGLVDSGKGGFKNEAPAVRSPVDGVLLSFLGKIVKTQLHLGRSYTYLGVLLLKLPIVLYTSSQF
jgi:hypothetical protein